MAKKGFDRREYMREYQREYRKRQKEKLGSSRITVTALAKRVKDLEEIVALLDDRYQKLRRRVKKLEGK